MRKETQMRAFKAVALACLLLVTVAETQSAETEAGFRAKLSAITKVTVVRMDIADALDRTVLTTAIPERVKRITQTFSRFRCVAGATAKSSDLAPCFNLRLQHGQETLLLLVTVKRSKTTPVGEKDSIPSAVVTLWKALPTGEFEQYAMEVSGPLKDSELPESIIVLKALFQDGKGPIKDDEYLKLEKAMDNNTMNTDKQ
jgi:hypothetical protein